MVILAPFGGAGENGPQVGPFSLDGIPSRGKRPAVGGWPLRFLSRCAERQPTTSDVDLLPSGQLGRTFRSAEVCSQRTVIFAPCGGAGENARDLGSFSLEDILSKRKRPGE